MRTPSQPIAGTVSSTMRASLAATTRRARSGGSTTITSVLRRQNGTRPSHTGVTKRHGHTVWRGAHRGCPGLRELTCRSSRATASLILAAAESAKQSRLDRASCIWGGVSRCLFIHTYTYRNYVQCDPAPAPPTSSAPCDRRGRPGAAGAARGEARPRRRRAPCTLRALPTGWARPDASPGRTRRPRSRFSVVLNKS